MKKKLLIFGYTLDLGGAEKELIDTLSYLHQLIDIDLYVFNKNGVLTKKVPENIKVYELKKSKFEYFFFRYVPLYRKYKINKIYNQKKYDYVVGYMEGRSATWVSDITSSIPKKYAWVHTDVAKYSIGISDHEASQSYSKLDKIICVSNEAKINFCKKYHISSNKVDVIFNYINELEIKQLAKEFNPNNKAFTFVNVAMMRDEKRHDRLIMAAHYLKNKGYDFNIQLIGNGINYQKIKNMINEYQVADEVTLLGLKANPYPYIMNADAFVSSSSVEGYGIAIKEALLLKKKIISTDTAGPREILNDGKYGIIVKNNDEDIKYAMEDLIKNPQKYAYLTKALNNYKGDNERIKSQTLKLFDL